MPRPRYLIAPLAALVAGAVVLAGCGGGGDPAGADTAARQATPAPTPITCPEVISRKEKLFLQNDSPVRLRLTTDPESITCSDWSLTGNPTNINADGGVNIETGDQFNWTLERRAYNRKGEGSWVVSVKDAPMAARVGEVKLRLESYEQGGRGTAYVLEINSPPGSDTWVCGRDNPVKVGVMRTPGGQRDLMAFVKAPRVFECRQSGESREVWDDGVVFFTRAVTG